jgi:hypothetical protein
MENDDPSVFWPPTDATSATSPVPAATNRVSARARKLVAIGILTIGMLAGGMAAVSAATPDPSASPAPQASAGQSGGASGGSTAPNHSGNCPDR